MTLSLFEIPSLYKQIPVILFCLVFFNAQARQEKLHPIAKNGTIDITEWDFIKDGPLRLNGEWEFYWSQFKVPGEFQEENAQGRAIFNIPGIWNNYDHEGETLEGDGFATYRLFLKPVVNGKLYGLDLPTFYGSYKVWINGKLMVEVGKVGKTRADSKAGRKPMILPFFSNADKIEIVIQISNFRHSKGGMYKSIKLGDYNQLLNIREQTIMTSLFLSGALIITGIVFLSVFLLWRKDYATLYFGFLCLIWAFRTLIYDLYLFQGALQTMGWSLTTKIEYLTLPFALLTGVLFIKSLFPKETSGVFVYIVLGVTNVFSFVILVSPVKFSSQILIVIFASFTLSLVYLIYVLIKAVKNRTIGSWFSAIGVCIGLVIFVYDLISYWQVVEINYFVKTVGYTGVFFFNSMALVNRYAKTFLKIDSLRKQTMEQNEEILSQAEKLRKTNQTIEKQKLLLEDRNKKINDINNNLEKTISERTAELTKINHELDLYLYRSSHDLRSPITSILGLNKIAKLTIKDEASLTLFQKINETASGMDKMLQKLNLVHDIMKSEPYSETVVLNHMIDEIHDFFNDVLKEKNVKFEVSLDKEFTFLSNIFLLKVILINIIENAINYRVMSEESYSYVRLKAYRKKKKVVISICDNGIGIPETLKENIFQLYFKGHDSAKGSGLGLYISKKAIQKLKGEIYVDNKTRETEFKIILKDKKTKDN